MEPDLPAAAALLDVSVRELAAFSMEDPFHPGTTVTGALCRRPDTRYGALIIQAVNDRAVPPELVRCTPKLHYPFGRVPGDRQYRFPEAAEVRVYTKWDGTNVCAYSYADADGLRRTTYKSRLAPFLINGTYGAFADLWRDLLDAADPLPPSVRAGVDTGEFTASFELTGRRNAHLVVYEHDLQATLLFTVRRADGAVFPPEDEEPIVVLTAEDDVVAAYERLRDAAEADNRIEEQGDARRLHGVEGYVFHLRDRAGTWSLWKCKTESVEAMHWDYGALPDDVIEPTCRNALETGEALTVELVRGLLLEEFSEDRVELSATRIERHVKALATRIGWTHRVLAAYRETGLDVGTDGVGAVLRALSKTFGKNDMKRVHAALRQAEVL